VSILETNEDFKSLNTIDGFEESFKNSNQGTSTAASGKAIRVSEVLGADITREQRHDLYKQEYPYLTPEDIDAVGRIANKGQLFGPNEETRNKFALLLTKFDLIKRSDNRNKVKDARDANIDENDSLSEEVKEELKKDGTLLREALKAVEAGEKTPEEVIEDIEKYIAQEYSKAASFIHQNYLLVNSSEINKVLRSTANYPTYDKILVSRIEDSSSNPLGPYVGKKEGARLLTFTTAQLSSLVPQIKLFKIIIEGSKRRKIEIPFPTISLGYSKTGKIFRQSPNDKGQYFKNRDGFGIRSFEWQYNGQNEATKFTDLSANLSLYFQDFGQLTAERQAADGSSFTYLDLILPREAVSIDDAKVGKDTNAFVLAEVGWAVPTGSSLFKNEEIKAIQENKLSMFLQQINYELDFDSATTAAFTLNIEYHSAYETMAKNSSLNAILPSVEICKQIKQKKDEIGDVRERSKSGDNDKSSEQLKKLNDEFDKIKEEAIKQSYKFIFSKLLETNRVHYLKASLSQILNFQGMGNKTVAAISKSNSLSDEQKINVQKDIDTWQNAAAEENDQSEDIYFIYLGDLLNLIADNATDAAKLAALGKDPNISNSIRLLATNTGFASGEINIADIPVDVRLLSNFFYEEVIAKRRLTISISEFIKELMAKLIENKIEKFTENYKPTKTVYQTTFIDSKNSVTGLKESVGPIRSAFTPGTNYSYIAIYAVPKDGSEYFLKYPKDYMKSKKEDLNERGVYHFVFGSKDSVVKSASFKKTDIENLKEQRIFETQNPYALLANQFSVDIDMFGNTLFYPGRLIYINPAHSLGGKGRPWQEGSAYAIMGLGGYHQIRKVRSQISDGGFSTQLEADFVASGFKPKKNK
jgi:hypothetical protein